MSSKPGSRRSPRLDSTVVPIEEARKVRLLASEVPVGGEARIQTATGASPPIEALPPLEAEAAEQAEQEDMLEIRVRRLHRRDLKRTWEFLKLVFREVNRETVEYQRPRSRHRFFEVYEEEEGEQLLFEVGKEIVGYAECSYDASGSDNWINPRYFDNRGMRPLYVDELAVHPTYQGQGVGAFMLEQTQHLARLRGCTHLVLEVAENNKSALSWYRKRNFYRLDAAIFLAQKVDAEPDLLPPRKLPPKKPAPAGSKKGNGGSSAKSASGKAAGAKSASAKTVGAKSVSSKTASAKSARKKRGS